MNQHEPADDRPDDRNAQPLAPHEETAIDALLSEAIGDVRPRDFAPLILTRLRNESAAAGRAGQSVRPVSRATSQTNAGPSRRFAVISLFAAMAAVFLAIVLLRPDPVMPKAMTNKTDVAKPAPVQPVVTDKVPQPDPSKPAVRPPLRGVPLTMPEVAQIDPPADANAETTSPNRLAKPLAKPLSIALVSRQVEDQFDSYWASIGIHPSDVAGNDELAKRWTEALGIAFSADDVVDVGTVEKKLNDAAVARPIANRWLTQITEGGIDRLDAKRRSALLDDVSGAFLGDKSFRELFAAWIDGRGESSSAFWTAMGASSVRLTDGGLVRRLALVTLDADLRCIRCHDALIEGSGRQRDHWGLVSLLDSELQRDQDGWAVVADDVADHRRTRPTFYDAIDGSRRVARPGVAWVAEDVESLSVWSRQLADPNSVASRRLAGGIVNSLWQLVHGRPLQGSVVDPISAPHGEALSGLENELGDDLRRSNFDLGRTLALILGSPATRRSVPESLRNTWAIDSLVDRAAAEAFAAARPLATRLPEAKRLDQTMRAIGATLGSAETQLLGQLGDSVGNAKAKSDAGLSWDFPDRAESLPVQWLGRVDGLDQQVDHLAYLAGKSVTPPSVREATTAMRAADVGRETLLHRVWWLLQ
jgi:hypothetical protein